MEGYYLRGHLQGSTERHLGLRLLPSVLASTMWRERPVESGRLRFFGATLELAPKVRNWRTVLIAPLITFDFFETHRERVQREIFFYARRPNLC